MALDPIAERARLREKYPPLSRTDLIGLVVVPVTITLGGVLHHESVGVVALGLGVTALAEGWWQLVKLRIRRNADRFAGLAR